MFQVFLTPVLQQINTTKVSVQHNETTSNYQLLPNPDCPSKLRKYREFEPANRMEEIPADQLLYSGARSYLSPCQTINEQISPGKLLMSHTGCCGSSPFPPKTTVFHHYHDSQINNDTKQKWSNSK